MKTQNFLVITFISFLACNIFNNAFADEECLVGRRGQFEELLDSDEIEESYKLFRSVEIEKTFSGYNNSMITCIKLITTQNGHPPTVTVTDGGTDHNYVTLSFVSAGSRGIYTKIEIYGRRCYQKKNVNL